MDRIFALLLLVVFGVGVSGALEFTEAGRLFPLTISLVGCVLTALWLGRSFFSPDAPPDDGEGQVDIAVDTDIPAHLFWSRLVRFLAWAVGFFLAIWLLGFKISVPLYLAAYLRIEAKAGYALITILIVASVYLLFVHFTEVLGVVWPEPFIGRFIDLPDFLK